MALRPEELLTALAFLAVLAPSCTDRTPPYSELGRVEDAAEGEVEPATA